MLFRREKKRFVPGMVVGMVAGIGVASATFFVCDRKKMDAMMKTIKRIKAAAGQYMQK